MFLFALCFFFFFQAEDGIRDLTVTGVQTCALPICPTVTREGHSAVWAPRLPQGAPERTIAIGAAPIPCSHDSQDDRAPDSQRCAYGSGDTGSDHHRADIDHGN